MTDVARSTNILGLYPGSLYNVTIVAESKSGKGPGRSGLFWTEVGGKYIVSWVLSPGYKNVDKEFS